MKLACLGTLYDRREKQVTEKVKVLTTSGISCKAGSTDGGFPCVILSPKKRKRVSVSCNSTVVTRKIRPRHAAVKARVALAKYKLKTRKIEFKLYTLGDKGYDGNSTDHSDINPMYEYQSDDSN